MKNGKKQRTIYRYPQKKTTSLISVMVFPSYLPNISITGSRFTSALFFVRLIVFPEVYKDVIAKGLYKDVRQFVAIRLTQIAPKLLI